MRAFARFMLILIVIVASLPAGAQDDGGILSRIVKLAELGWNELVGASDLFSLDNIAAAKAILKSAGFGSFEDIFSLEDAASIAELFSEENLELVAALYSPENIESAREIITMVNTTGIDGEFDLSDLPDFSLPSLSESVVQEAHDAIRIERLACSDSYTYFELRVDGARLLGTVDITIDGAGDAVISNILPLPLPESLGEVLAFDVAPVIGVGAVKLASHGYPPLALALTAGETVMEAAATLYDWFHEQKALGRPSLAPFTLQAGPQAPPIALLIQGQHSADDGNGLIYSANYDLGYDYEGTAPNLDVAAHLICSPLGVAVAGAAVVDVPAAAPSPQIEGAIVVEGECTLKDAIRAANRDEARGSCPAGDGADVIVMTGDITLVGENPDIESAITIEGGGHTISGDGKYRIFNVARAANLTVKDMTLTKGFAGPGSLSCGGSGDYAEQGGAICSYGTLKVQTSEFVGNKAHDSGGAISSNGEIFSVRDSVFSENRSDSSGGAIWLKYGTVSSSVFSQNAAKYYGGAIANGSGKGTIESSDFRGNSAGNGGGAIANVAYGAGTDWTIADNDFTNNSAAKDGGALRVSRSRLRGNVFSNNRPNHCHTGMSSC